MSNTIYQIINQLTVSSHITTSGKPIKHHWVQRKKEKEKERKEEGRKKERKIKKKNKREKTKERKRE